MNRRYRLMPRSATGSSWVTGHAGHSRVSLMMGYVGHVSKNVTYPGDSLASCFALVNTFFTNTDYDHLLARQSHAHTAASNPSDVRQPEADETLWNLYQPPAFIIDTKTEMDREERHLWRLLPDSQIGPNEGLQNENKESVGNRQAIYITITQEDRSLQHNTYLRAMGAELNSKSARRYDTIRIR